CSRSEIHCKTHSFPVLRFEDSQLTSYSGLILIQELFVRLGLKERLRRCFSHLTVGPIFGYPTLVLCLVENKGVVVIYFGASTCLGGRPRWRCPTRLPSMVSTCSRELRLKQLAVGVMPLGQRTSKPSIQLVLTQ
ncbi:MAG: hypothetical protein ACREU0_11325, partial [Burkholderiales bacterium]